MTKNQSDIVLHRAEERDIPVIMRLIKELAEYEQLADAVTGDEEALHTWLFGEQTVAEVVLAYCDGEIAGFALFFANFSTFLTKPGLYLEDLFVRQNFRGRGIGKTLLTYLAALVKERGWGRFEWSVLNWNRPAIDFYQSLGAAPMSEWTTYRVGEAALSRLAHTFEETRTPVISPSCLEQGKDPCAA